MLLSRVISTATHSSIWLWLIVTLLMLAFSTNKISNAYKIKRCHGIG